MNIELANLELIIAGLLLIATLVALITERVRFPYTVGLVIVGVLLAVFVPEQISLDPDLTRDLILFLLLPPLVFEAALHIEYNDFRDNLPTILTYAVPGVLLTTGLVSVLMSVFTDLPLASLLVFGALISATDPVAVVAIFRKLGLPKRLGLLTEGESLLNDATAIVVFGLMLEFALRPADFSVLSGIAEFVRVAAGGVLIGLILGLLAYYLIRQIDAYLIETALSAVLAYGSYLLAEEIHVSGVLAVVVAGIMIGNEGKQYGMSHTTRNVLTHIWEFLAFLANSFVFLLIGFEIKLGNLAANWPAVLIAIVVVLLVRAISIYSLSTLPNRFARNRVPFKWQTVLVWGGLRGGIALALAFTLPQSLPGRDLILVMTVGVVLFTLVVQATTLPALLRRLGMISTDTGQLEYQRRRAQLVAARAAQKYTKSQYDDGLLSRESYDILKPELEGKIDQYAGAVREALTVLPDIRDDELEAARRRVFQVKRDALRQLRHDGIITTEVYDELAANIDAELEREH